ncbi:gamma carbonic anhydrase family protein [Bartonella sp. HY329]|uniref:gamma carbonic anhydrase family protein n=1 Tax=unclassified Bartonella TaxID=2645622 RepID=UPI0021C5E148|nr:MULTISPECIES: gamma carbonic anhydrase family protein [unclassified Bartonella]UXM94096.1 gamma carbonic anhydrase family protein [Bartonella sp. HY329]UXN08418.1 gamma carbonic anhydrase family protein [Bartonella sp. HY328]
MTIYVLDGHMPHIVEKKTSFVAKSADIIGQVIINDSASIWFGAILRGDNEPIIVGEGSNVQDGATIHTDKDIPVTIGRNCTIGHRAIIHGCIIGDNCLIGMGAVIMNKAVIGENSIVGAGALVTEGQVFPANSLIIGCPAKVKRSLTEGEIAKNTASAKLYQKNSIRYINGLEEMQKTGL